MTPTISLTRRRFSSLAGATALSALLVACSDNSQGSSQTPVADASDASGSNSDVDPITTAGVELPTPDGEVDWEAALAPGPLEERWVGEDDAPVTIIEYMSMTCPHCAAFHAGAYKVIKEKYIDTGKVRMIVREFPFDPRAAAAAMLARCAPENQHFPMIDVLFKQQSNWARAEDARNALLQISRLAGFTQESFEACLTDQKLLDDINTVRTKAVEDFGVGSTPTFLIHGKRYAGNMSADSMSAIIDSLL